LEAGCDEAGRGCLAGPVYAAAVVMPKGYRCLKIDDSKKLSAKDRYELRTVIQNDAIAYAVASVSEQEIDKINILNASFEAMHRAIAELYIQPELLLIDGNRFNQYKNLDHQCIIKGDSLYTSIAAASILAKTYRDDHMEALDHECPEYGWCSNKGYATLTHRIALQEIGPTKYHRKSFVVKKQLRLNLENHG
jgi:ribonuclease HII